LAILLLSGPTVPADDDEKAKLGERLESEATTEKMIMVPMRDGVRLATYLYRPAGNEERLPTVFWRTPYNFNQLSERRLELVLAAIERGYAVVIQNERGKFYSEGNWTILGHPRTDGADALDWIAAQPWSDGKVGTLGCSSSAEWQLALAAIDHPAHAAMVPMASGAGIGRVGPFHEHGNWYKGGVFQMLFATWLYSVQHTVRPTFPPDTPPEELARLSRYFDLAPEMPDVDWQDKLRHLPLGDLLKEVDGPSGTFEEFITRTPADPGWYEGGLYHDDEPFGVPSLWMNSWYDVSIGPNLALYNHARKKATEPGVAAAQYAVVAPTPHCRFFDLDEKETRVGERDMGHVELDAMSLIFDWFDWQMKGEDNGFPDENPRVRYYLMGANEWRSAETWPPPSATNRTYHLDSDGRANSLFGDGRLVTEKPGGGSDSFPYDPTTPVPSLGGGVCCIGGAVEAGSYDQRPVEARHDVLVYTSEPLEQGIEVSGWIETTLWVSSTARDTDFSVKLVDVLPDGTAYNLDDTIQRARYREGFDRSVLMHEGEIYELKLSPMATSNYFAAGHRIRVEISSSNFPRYARNLNTGGANHDEHEPLRVTNTIHHSRKYPSRIVLPVVEPAD
jgi:putative CocE/NonD family hydrolase